MNPSTLESDYEIIKNEDLDHIDARIMPLQKHLVEYSIKEAQIRSEKVVLGKRIAYMRMAFDH